MNPLMLVSFSLIARPAIRQLFVYVGLALLVVVAIAAIGLAVGLSGSRGGGTKPTQIVVTLPSNKGGTASPQLVQPILVESGGQGSPLWVSGAAAIGGLLSGLGGMASVVAKRDRDTVGGKK
jgi:hypothetical protein